MDTNNSIKVNPLDGLLHQFPKSVFSPVPPSMPSAPNVYKSYELDLFPG